MTSIENCLALQIIKERFGDLARSIAALLIVKNSYPFILIAEELKMSKKMVSQIISTLITQNLVDYQLNSRNIIEYKLNTKNTIDRLKIARSINLVKKIYKDDFSALILKEIYLHGHLEMSSILLKLLARYFEQNNLKQKINDYEFIFSIFNQIKMAFIKLAEDNFIEKLSDIEVGLNEQIQNGSTTVSKIPKFLKTDEMSKGVWKEIKIEEARMKKSIEEDTETPSCYIRRQNENFGDNQVYWKINSKKVIEIFRNEMLIEALENRIDKTAGNILRVCLRIVDAQILSDKATNTCYQSKAVTSIDLQKVMRAEYKTDSITIDKYLNVIVQDSFKVLDKIGDFSGGAYCLDFKKALNDICLAHIESYVRERYGSKSLRIFRVILEKYQLEQKQIEDFSMIPSKDCKSLLYSMLNDGLLSITELSKTSDHAPSRTFYLFYIDVYQIAKKLLENAYKSMTNLMIKREHLTKENKRLLEKNQKINTRIEALVAQGASQQELDYEKSMMSNEELNQLNSFTEHCNKIELAEIQLEESIFVFENYFYYHTVPLLIPPGKRA